MKNHKLGLLCSILLFTYIKHVIIFNFSKSESPTVSTVNSLGKYLLISLCFVFAALIEFALVIILHHRTKSEKIDGKNMKKQKPKKSIKLDPQYRNFGPMRNGKAKSRISSDNGIDQDRNKMQNANEGMSFPRKVDLFCFVAYLFGYCFFNVIYWIDMLSA